jgi:biopolymer transport protein ExbB
VKHSSYHHRIIWASTLCAALLLAAPLRAQQAPAVANPSAAAPARIPPASPAPAPAPGAAAAANTPALKPTEPATQAVATQNIAAGPPAATMPHELSVWSMFMSADIVVKAVMTGLAFGSLVTWTICLAKSIELAGARHRLYKALSRVRDSSSMMEAQLALGKSGSVLSAMLAAAMHEARMSPDFSAASGIKERVASCFAEIVRADARSARRGMGMLATIGATAPFVGLFGTVWGIMNSFIGISKAQTTNLAVVAPGIAEALLATAIGLVTAIPAVIIYNHFSRATKSYLDLVARASGTTMRLLSRDLDHHAKGAVAQAAE